MSYTKAMIMDIGEMYTAGMSVPEIAAQVKLPIYYIESALHILELDVALQPSFDTVEQE
jgi:hypothetical protein